ncbi:MAG: PKD domain-containing protein, partial [Paludibacteraceae bacterium]|nr:PKD domain-containing protein [Paludibacteraceae bacterium]
MKKISIVIITFVIGLSNSFAQNKTYSINAYNSTNYIEISMDKNEFSFVSENAKRFRELIINPIFQSTDKIRINDTIVLDLFVNKYYKAYIDKIAVDVNGTVIIRARFVDYNYAYCLISTFNDKSLIQIEVPEENELYMSKYDQKTNKYYLSQIDKTKQVALEGSPPELSPTNNKHNNSLQNNPKDSLNLYFENNKTTNSDNDSNDTILLNDSKAQDIVTLLIVYTPAAATWASENETNINNTISLLMERNQLALDNSNTQLTIQLVHSAQVSYTELNNNTDLHNLTNTGDGILENVHTLRNTYCADVVVLLEEIDFTGGVGWLLSTTSGMPTHAFSLTRVQQASWTYTTIHEIGHNMGCHHHNSQNYQPGPGLYTYSAGWRWTGTNGGNYCSVMTYESGSYFSDGINHTRVPYFSNPSILHQGVSTGDAANGDNARTIRQIKSVIAAYRSQCTPYCSGTTSLVASSATFTDGSGTSNYGNNADCKWLINPDGATGIRLRFTDFTTESGFDYVKIYDGPTTSSPLLGAFSGSSIPSVVTSTGGIMLVHFTTDASSVAAGWTASYTASYCIGTEIVTESSGFVTDGSGFNNYGDYSNCQWLIQPPNASTIELIFTAFATETGYDYVNVYDGSTTSSPLLGSFSGTTIPDELTSSGGQILVTFTTDGGVNAAGWEFYYYSQINSFCSGTQLYSENSGYINDGSNDFNYGDNSDCKWLIQPPGVSSITLDFLSFSTEECCDFVEVYDGPTTSYNMLGAFSGNSLPPQLISSGGSMLVHFVTDASVQYNGWELYYNSNYCHGITDLSEQESEFNDGSGDLFYGNYADCQWLIQPGNADIINLTFSSFSTEQNFDYVTVYDGPDVSSPIIGQYSGNFIPPEITAYSGSMLVHFTSDGSVYGEGWSAYYTSCSYPVAAGSINGDVFVCQGDNSVIYSVSEIANADVYYWSLPENVTGISNTNTISVNFSENALSCFISVAGYNNLCGYGEEAILEITVNEKPQIELGSDMSQCGGSNTLNAGAGFSSYTWNGVAGTQTNTVTSSGVYSVVVSNSAGCTASDQIQVTISTPPVAGTLTANNLTGYSTVCVGNSISFFLMGSVGFENLEYRWENTDGTFTSWNTSWTTNNPHSITPTDVSIGRIIHVRARSGSSSPCNDVYSNTVEVEIIGIPVIELGDNITQCGGSVTLDAGADYSSYTWNGNTGIRYKTVNASGTYTVVVGNSAGCTASDAVDVTINPEPSVYLNMTQESYAGAMDGTATANASNGTPSYDYSWSNEQSGQTIYGLSAGQYCVTVSDANGCTATECITVAVSGQSNPPTAQFSADQTEACGSLVVQFTDQSTNNPTVWQWNFGDGSPVSNLQHPQHNYTTPGTYSVSLFVENNDGENELVKTNYITVHQDVL